MHLCVNPHGNLGQQGAASIDDHIAESRFAQWHERLVPFVHASVDNRDHQRPESPLDPPTRTFAAHAVENGNAQSSKLGNMSGFANQEVEQVESVPGDPGIKPAENGKDHARRVLAAEVLGGKRRN